jgi:hypothetical protein
MVSQTWRLRRVRESCGLNDPCDRFKDEFGRNRLGTMRTIDFRKFHVGELSFASRSARCQNAPEMYR